MSKKKTALISLLVIVSLGIIIVVVTPLLTPLFQSPSDLRPEHDAVETTRTATNNNTSINQTAGTSIMPPTTIDIISTTSAFPFVQRWVAQYENQQPASSGNVNVDYMADREIIAAEGNSGRSELAIVGVPSKNNNTVYVPVSAQAVAIVYNIPSFPDIPSGLRLNSTTLYLILNGSITRWDDAAIKYLNPSLNLPDERIVVVQNGGDNSNGTTSSSSLVLLNQYLGHPSSSWPKNDTIAASGPAELAEMVRKIPYSIGFVDFSYAVQTKMTYAAIEDGNGDYIVPSMQSIGRTVDVALQFHNDSTDGSSSQQQQPPPTINASRLVSDSYPIVGLYYASLLANDDDHEEEEQEGRIVAMLDFVKWIIAEGGGQQTLLEVQYPPIYAANEQLATYAKIMIDTIQKSLSN